jgi:hypothetical protein
VIPLSETPEDELTLLEGDAGAVAGAEAVADADPDADCDTDADADPPAPAAKAELLIFVGSQPSVPARYFWAV